MRLGSQVVYILKSYVLKSFTVAFAIFLIVLVIWLVRGFIKGDYWNAKRARSRGDIELAAELFKRAVKEDAKGTSYKAVLALVEMDEPQGLWELIDLMDIADMYYIDVGARVEMCEAIRSRTAGTTADGLPLDPRASQEARRQQKLQWQAWLAGAGQEYRWLGGKFVRKETP